MKVQTYFLQLSFIHIVLYKSNSRICHDKIEINELNRPSWNNTNLRVHPKVLHILCRVICFVTDDSKFFNTKLCLQGREFTRNILDKFRTKFWYVLIEYNLVTNLNESSLNTRNHSLYIDAVKIALVKHKSILRHNDMTISWELDDWVNLYRVHSLAFVVSNLHLCSFDEIKRSTIESCWSKPRIGNPVIIGQSRKSRNGGRKSHTNLVDCIILRVVREICGSIVGIERPRLNHVRSEIQVH